MTFPVHQVVVMWESAPRCSFQDPGKEYFSDPPNKKFTFWSRRIMYKPIPGIWSGYLLFICFWAERILTTMQTTHHFTKVALPYNIIQWESNTGLVVPNLPHDVIEKGHNTDTSIWISMLQFCKHCWSKVISETGRKCMHSIKIMCSHSFISKDTMFQFECTNGWSNKFNYTFIEKLCRQTDTYKITCV